MRRDKGLAYFFLRVSIGLSFLGHGLVRFPKIPGFRNWMLEQFKNAMLPQPFVHVFATILPFAEFLIGVMLILGWRTKLACSAGSVLIALLIFGSCLIENWDAVGFQMIYAVFFFILLFLQEYNTYALDKNRNA